MSGYRRRIVLREISEMLRPGDVVNFDSRGKNFFMRFIFSQICRAQKRKFGKKSRYRDIHSVLVLDTIENLVLSVTVPRAVIEPLRISKRTRRVTVCRLKGADDGFSDDWIRTMREAAMELVGHEYDWLQILAIKLKLQKWPKWITRWLDLGKKRTVCSGGVQYCLLKAWNRQKAPEVEEEQIGNGPDVVCKIKIPAPLYHNKPSETYPAHFPNHSTFTIAKEWKL